MYGEAPQHAAPEIVGEPCRYLLFVRDRRTGAWFLRELARDPDEKRFRHARRLAEQEYGVKAVQVVGPSR